MLILTGAMFVPAAFKTFWPQTSEDIPHFSSHTFLRTEISEEERLSLRARPMEQRAALSMYTRSANRSAPLQMTRRDAAALVSSHCRKRDAHKHQKLNAKVTRHTQQQAAVFTVTARSFPRIQEEPGVSSRMNGWYRYYFVFIILRKHFASFLQNISLRVLIRFCLDLYRGILQ